MSEFSIYSAHKFTGERPYPTHAIAEKAPMKPAKWGSGFVFDGYLTSCGTHMRNTQKWYYVADLASTEPVTCAACLRATR